MGNCFSISVSCDDILSRCLDCTVREVAYVRGLRNKLAALGDKMQRLTEARDGVMRRVMVDEPPQMKRTVQVQGWLSRVQAVESQVGELIRDGPQEIEKLCLGGFCSKNYLSSYKFSKKVSRKLQYLTDLMEEARAFEVVMPEASVDEMNSEQTLVGMESTFDKAWRSIMEEKEVGIIGLYGMGGVGKTTLLTQINNEFLDPANDFFVIWVVVSKDLQLGKIQEQIGKRIGLSHESWKIKSLEDKASDIFKILKDKKFILFLDDIWKRVDLTKVGVPLFKLKVGSKIVFTTRSLEVCGFMDADRKIKVVCLTKDDAWKLFQQKVGEDTLRSDPDILELAKVVVEECGGLPLAIITIGRAMASKKTPQEWNYAIQVLKTSRAASELQGIGEEVYPLLKFSYDSLSDETIRSCLLYCTLFPEDYPIYKEELIDCWIGEGFFDGYDKSLAQGKGYNIIGILLDACLLEEAENDRVKMHDVIRDMSLWIAREMGTMEKRFLVHAGAGLSEAPRIGECEEVRRMSLMRNQIVDLSEVPSCPHLLTLFLNSNKLKEINTVFFNSMPSLKVLNLSFNSPLTTFPSGIINLISLQLLDLSWTSIKELPEELGALVNLKCLNLEFTLHLKIIPRQLISKFSFLRVLRMFYCSSWQGIPNDSVLFGNGEYLVEELLLLEHLNVLSVDIRSLQALQKLMSSQNLQSCTQTLRLFGIEDSTSFNVLSLTEMKHLNSLDISSCEKLEELEMNFPGKVTTTLAADSFHNLQTVSIVSCSKIKDLTWLVFAPKLKLVFIFGCSELEEIISVGKLGKLPMKMKLPVFARLRRLVLDNLPKLKSIYSSALPFPNLKEIHVLGCPELKQLPLDSNNADGHKIIIGGREHWWKELQWKDPATEKAFRSCFVEQL